MKILWISMLICLWGKGASCQLWNEWFRQEETALRYGAEQIAALRAYGSALQKGYATVQEGLHTIDQIKKGDFGQHLAYIAGLSQVKPQIKNEGIVLIQLLAQTDQLSRQGLQWIKGTPYLGEKEKKYGQQVYQQLNKRCEEILGQLHVLTTDGAGTMTDAERLQRKDRLYHEVVEIYGFTQHFGSSFRQLVGQRRQAQKEGKVIEQFSLQ